MLTGQGSSDRHLGMSVSVSGSPIPPPVAIENSPPITFTEKRPMAVGVLRRQAIEGGCGGFGALACEVSYAVAEHHAAGDARLSFALSRWAGLGYPLARRVTSYLPGAGMRVSIGWHAPPR
jgi:hypothetical protein